MGDGRRHRRLPALRGARGRVPQQSCRPQILACVQGSSRTRSEPAICTREAELCFYRGTSRQVAFIGWAHVPGCREMDSWFELVQPAFNPRFTLVANGDAKVARRGTGVCASELIW